jgi:AcrR family transcriptional regulator
MLSAMISHPAAGETITVVRRFSRAQADKRAAARRAAAELAAQGGYPAVTMAAVADRIGIARATIYRYFSSKDHLLAEVTTDWAQQIDADFRRKPPAGTTLADRVAVAFERVIATAARNPGLTAALVLAATSADPAADGALRAWASPVDVYLKTLIGKEKVPQLKEIAMVLSYVLFSALIAMALRGQDPAEAANVLRTTARLLLAPSQQPPKAKKPSP